MADDEVTVERTAGDDWLFSFELTDVNGDSEDLTDTKYEGVLVGPKPGQTRTLIMDDGNAGLEDQTDPSTMGHFFVKVPRDITKTIPQDVASSANQNTQLRGIPVLLKIAQYDKSNNRNTIGSIRIMTKR